MKHVAVVGATGAVGKELIRLLEARNFPVASLRLLASSRSAGKTLSFKGEDIVIEDLATASFDNIDIALFSAGGERSREYAAKFVEAGAVVIDNSSAFRMDDNVPLIIPEINAAQASQHHGIIANPNCTTIVALMALWPLHQAFQLTRFTAASYQAASGAGRAAMEELIAQTKSVLQNPDVTLHAEAMPQPLAFNVVPHVDSFDDTGYTKEELKLTNETHKIFNDDSIRISGTCVRVPVLRAHSVAVHAEFKTPATVAEARTALSQAAGLQVIDDPASLQYPMPTDAAGKDDVMVGRIRKDLSCDNGLALWCVGDQILKGAALNAIQIAELLLDT